MDGFTNSLFPRLNALGITNNNFNCSYLKRFMRFVIQNDSIWVSTSDPDSDGFMLHADPNLTFSDQ